MVIKKSFNMKNLIVIASALLLCISCSKQNVQDESIEKNDATLVKSIGDISYKIINVSPFRIQSDKLKEISVTLNGKQSYGYIHTNQPNNDNPEVNLAAPDGWSMVWGHFFYGECLVYGCLITGNNGVQMFIPCGLNQCIGEAFAPICPPPGGGIARGN
jgi:hypothetical protein